MNRATASSSWDGPVAAMTSSPAAEPDATDASLLASYLLEKNGDAFTKLVQRHWSLVYGVAYRRIGNATLAQDIAQAVFILLDRKCADFSKGTVLAGWLFRTAMFTTKNALKAEARRQQREHEALAQLRSAAAEGPADESNPEQAWEAISGHLDEGLMSLSARDRDTIILRFLQDRSFKEVGVSFGLNEHGARQQALRALDRLRKYFRRRAIFYPVASLALAFGARPVASAPLQNLGSETAKSLAAAIVAHARRRRVQLTLLASGLMFAVFLGFTLLIVRREARTGSVARRRTIEAVDRTLWLGDATAFAALISFGSADLVRAQKLLRDYCVAYHELRQSYVERFGEPVPGWLGTLRALAWLGGDRLREQATVNLQTRAIDQIVPGYSMHLILENNGWKWDLFDQTTQAETNEFLGQIERKTAVLHRLALKNQMDGFARAEDIAHTLLDALEQAEIKKIDLATETAQ